VQGLIVSSTVRALKGVIKATHNYTSCGVGWLVTVNVTKHVTRPYLDAEVLHACIQSLLEVREVNCRARHQRRLLEEHLR
jgi:hypothetical protein